MVNSTRISEMSSFIIRDGWIQRKRSADISLGAHLHPGMTRLWCNMYPVCSGLRCQIAYSILPRFPRAFSRSAVEQAQEQVVLCLAVAVPGTRTVDSRRSHRELEPLSVGMPLKLKPLRICVLLIGARGHWAEQGHCYPKHEDSMAF